MSTKFFKNLTMSNKEIKGKRAVAVEEQTKAAFEGKLREYEDKLRKIKAKIWTLEDLALDTTTFLNPTGSKFDAEAWANDMDKYLLEKDLVKVDIKRIKKIIKKYFSVEEEETKAES